MKPEDIDRDPLALMPGGPIVLSVVDAASLFQTPLGSEVANLVTSLLPLGPEANFVPQRDVTRAVGGVYTMQGADFCSVMQGSFDVEAIRRAAATRAATPSGQPLVRTPYADRELYTVGNVGFVVVTAHTLVAGNEVGMRRALDRLRFGSGEGDRLERAVPSWMVDLAEPIGKPPPPGKPPVHLAIGIDLETTPGSSAVSGMPVTPGLLRGRVIGNFTSPGVNLAGTLTYRDAMTAAAGARDVQTLGSFAKLVSFFTSFGLAGSPTAQAEVRGNDVGFAMAVDDATVRTLLRVLAQASRRS